MRHMMLATFCTLVLAGCGGSSGPAPAASTPSVQPEAVMRIGDVTIRANAMQTSALSPEITSRYGIPRNERTVMVLVGVRQGSDARETSLPATVTATATNLSGQRQPIAFRELRSGDATTGSGPVLLDYIGTVETSLPDTLLFDMTIARDGGTSTMQFRREFFPR